MVRDLVCSMEVEETKAGATYDYQGQTYYFCASGCRDQFVDLLSPDVKLSKGNREGAPVLGDE